MTCWLQGSSLWVNWHSVTRIRLYTPLFQLTSFSSVAQGFILAVFSGNCSRIWKILIKHYPRTLGFFSYPKMSMAKSFSLVLVLIQFISNSLTPYPVILNYTTAYYCGWSPFLIQHTKRYSLRVSQGSGMKGAANLICCGYWKRPAGNRGWNHSSALENWVPPACTCLLESSVTSSKLFQR